jgi:transglutaminase-like putative cysteine protease
MTGRHQLGLIAAAARAAAPLASIFEHWTWLSRSAVAVGLVAGAAALARWWRAPLWAQALAMVGALLFGLTWMFPSGDEPLGVLPGLDTLAHFGELLAASAGEIRSYGIPVPDTTPLLFITVGGIGAVAVAVDLCAVGLRRPALAGLPMLAIYSVPVAVHTESVPAFPFIVGAAGFLWLLAADNIDRVRRFGHRFTGDGRPVDVWEASPLAASGRRLAIVGVILAVLLPLAVPGFSTSLLDQYATGGDGPGRGGKGGTSGRVNLFAALSGELNRSEVRNLVTVRTTDPDPYYLRFAVADELRASGFAVRGPSGSPVTRVLDDVPAPDDGLVRHRHEATVRITDDFNMPFLPVYAEPVRMRGVGANWLYDPNSQIVYSNKELSKGRQYTFDYLRTEYDPTVLRAAAPLPPEHPNRRLYTALPHAVPAVTELVEELTADRSTPYDRVRAIYDHFSRANGFRYSLNTEGGTSGQEIVSFLNNKAGFCQQYASAMAWLVRAAGIPARVAFGFTTGTPRRDGTFTLTNLNLHAWTEVYFDGIGWVPFDPTPAANVPGSTRPAWAPDVDAPVAVPTTPAPGANPATGGQPATGNDRLIPRDVDENTAIGDSGPVGTGPRWPWWLAGALAALLVLLGLPAVRRNRLRRRRYARMEAAAIPRILTTGGTRAVRVDPDTSRLRADAHAAWDELLDSMVDYRIPVDPTETPRATVERLATRELADPAAREAIRLLGQAEERARYAREPLAAVGLTAAVRTVRTALAAEAGRRAHALATVLPASILRRWRSAGLETLGRLVTVGSRLRVGLVRWNPRRLLIRPGDR